MELGIIIKHLLIENECVVVPGFGGFLTEDVPAAMTATAIRPPAKTFRFNRGIKKDDGLIVTQVKNASETYAAALGKIETEAREWQKTLSAEKSLRLDQLGTIKQWEDGRWEFYPMEDNNDNPENYGLREVKIVPLSAQSDADNLKGGARRKYRFRQYAVAALVLLALGILSIFAFNHFEGQVASVMPSITADSPFTTSAVEDEISAPVKAMPDFADPEKVVSPIDPTPRQPISEGPFHLIVGSFPSQAAAKKEMEEWTSKGYSPRLLSAAKGRYRLSIVDGADSAAIAQQLKGFSGTDYWILKQ